MSYFEANIQVSLKQCDLCGYKQQYPGHTFIRLDYHVTGEGSHGSWRDYPHELHLCGQSDCIAKLAELIKQSKNTPIA